VEYLRRSSVIRAGGTSWLGLRNELKVLRII
jgi:hypothetical protein